jgi:hypothetical protein
VTPYENTDREYKGPVNEDGLEWSGDLECYIPNDWTTGYSYVAGRLMWMLLGKPQIIVTEGEYKAARDSMTKEELGPYLLEHHKNPKWTDDDQLNLESRETLFND